MIYALMGFLHAAVVGRVRRIHRLAGGEAGQGTVEYVGLILLVSLLMVGMVAAMKGFNSYLSKTGQYSLAQTETASPPVQSAAVGILPEDASPAQNEVQPCPGHAQPA